jgi:L-proline amide hydrolase
VSGVADGVREGKVPFELDGETAETWYRVTGEVRADAPLAPLVVLHGGPGGTHDYLVSLADLAGGGRAVIHYDQLAGERAQHALP